MQRIWLAFTIALLGCGGPGPRDVVSPRKVSSASGPPSIRSVTDLGDLGAIPTTGAMPAFDSDSTFVVGELVLIEGSNFGKQPTINIGGRPAESVARTGNGGIVARIPPAVPTGSIEVEVSHKDGRNAVPIEVKRYGLVVQPGSNTVHVIELGKDSAITSAGTIELTGARDVCISHDGSAALIAAAPVEQGGVAHVGVVAMTSSGGPAVVRDLRLIGDQASEVTCASAAPFGAIITGNAITLVDLEDGRNPALYNPFISDIRGDKSPITAIALSPDGDLLAVLHAQGNRLISFDLSKANEPRSGRPVRVMPEARVPLISEVGFSPTADQIWVIAGDNPDSVKAGVHPTQLIRVDVNREDLNGYKVERTVDVANLGAPQAMAVPRRESVVGGTAIGTRERRATLALAAADRAFVTPDADLTGVEIGQIVRSELDGTAETLATDPGVVTALAMTHDVQYAVAVTSRLVDGAVEVGVVSVPLAGGDAAYVRLASGAVDQVRTPAGLALAP